MNLTMRLVADSVNLRTELLPRRVRILIEQRLNPVVVLLKQRPDLLLLLRSQLQVLCKVSKLLVDRLRCVDMLQLLTRRGLLCPVVLSYGRARNSEHEHNPICKRGRSISHGWGKLLKILDIIPAETLIRIDGEFHNELHSADHAKGTYSKDRDHISPKEM